MANICTMRITFFCNGILNNAGLLALHKELASLGGDGKLITLLSEKEKTKVSDERAELKHVSEISVNAVSFTVDVETAWTPNHALITALCSKFLGVSYASASDEANEDLFEIYNDPEWEWFPFEYSIDVWGNSMVPELCEFLHDEEATYECLKKNFGHMYDGEDVEGFDEFLEQNDLGRVRHWYRMMPSDYDLDVKERLVCIHNIGDAGIYLYTDAPDGIIQDQLRLNYIKESCGINIVNEYDLLEDQGYSVRHCEDVSGSEDAVCFYQKDYGIGSNLQIKKIVRQFPSEAMYICTNAPDDVLILNRSIFILFYEGDETSYSTLYGTIKNLGYDIALLDYSYDIKDCFKLNVDSELDLSHYKILEDF